MTTLAVIPEAVSKVLAENGLSEDRSALVIEAYSPWFAAANAKLAESKEIRVTDPTQVTAMRAARAARLALKDIRVEAEKVRKSLKEESLRTGRGIDGLANVLKMMVEPEEARLEQCEKFAERIEQARIAKLVAQRTTRLAVYGVNAGDYSLATMTDAAFDELVSMLAKRREEALAAELAAKQKAEAERIAKEAEDARVRAENARLKAEAEQAERERLAAKAKAEAELAAAKREAERVAAEERKAADAKLASERRAREEAERQVREAAAKQEAERAAKAKAEADAKRKAERAPDHARAESVIASLKSVVVPEMKTAKGVEIARRLSQLLATTIAAMEEMASELK